MKTLKRVQFTHYDSYLHPECNNSKYLESEKITSGISEGICYFGYEIIDENGHYIWITLEEAKKIKENMVEF